jgi:glycosyltransferase involved in cell wall biosynthesis
MKISVAMCTYNGARFVGEQLASVAAQTREPDELVVCDDRSTDATVAVVKEFARRATFPVRLRVNESNLGSTRNFDRAVGLCAGDTIALSDQDDVWLPDKLRLCEEALDAAPDAGAVFTDAEIVDEDLRPTGRRLWSFFEFDGGRRRMVLEGRALELFAVYNYATGATMAFRSKYRELILPTPPDGRYIHDGWIALMIASVARLTLIPEPTILYRQHPGQQLGVRLESPGGADDPRAAVFAGMIQNYRAVYGRLRERCQLYGCGAALEEVAARLAHFEARTSLPRSPLRRAPVVLRELLSRRYHRYGRGLRSAARDLLS